MDSDTEAIIGPAAGRTSASPFILTPPTTLTVTGSIGVAATSTQKAIVDLDRPGATGGGSGGVIAVAWLIGDAKLTGATRALIGDGTTIDQAGSIDVTATVEAAIADSQIFILTVGGISIGGSQAFATSTPSIVAAIGDGVLIGTSTTRIDGSITVKAAGRAEADTVAKAYGGGAVQVGIPEARSTIEPFIDAHVGTHASGGTVIWTVGGIAVTSTLSIVDASGTQTDFIQSADLDDDTIHFQYDGVGEGMVVRYDVTNPIGISFLIGGLHLGREYTVLDTSVAGVIRLGSLFDASQVDPSTATIHFATSHGFITGDCVKIDARGGSPILLTGQSTAACGGFFVRVVDGFTIRLTTSDPTQPETPDVALGVDPNDDTRIDFVSSPPAAYGNGQAVLYHAPSVSTITTVVGLHPSPLSTGTSGYIPTPLLLVPGNTFSSGDAVTYHVVSGVAIGGLTDGDTYYVIEFSGDFIGLAASYCQAVGSVGTGCGSASINFITLSLGIGGRDTDRHRLERSIGGLVDGHRYYVVDRAADGLSIQVALTAGGAPIHLDSKDRPGPHTFGVVTVDLQVGTGIQAIYPDLTYLGLTTGTVPVVFQRLLARGGIPFSLALAPPGDGKSSATAEGDSGGGIDVSVPTAVLTGGPTVTGSINAARIDAIGNVSIDVDAVTGLRSYATNGGGGVVEVGITQAETRVGDAATTASIGNGTIILAGGDVVLEADADHTVNANAEAAGGGLAAAKVTKTTARIDPDTAVRIGEGARVEAGGVVRGRSTARVLVQTFSSAYSGGLGVGATADNWGEGGAIIGSSSDFAETKVVVGEGATVTGRAVDLYAHVRGFEADARAWAQSIAIAGGLVAIALVDIYTRASIDLGIDLDGTVSGARTRVTGYQGVDLRAITDGVTADRFPFRQGVCLCAQDAYAKGSNQTFDVVTASDAVLVTAGARPAGGGGLQDPRPDLEVALYVLSHAGPVNEPQRSTDLDRNYVDWHQENGCDTGYNDGNGCPGAKDSSVKWDADVLVLGGTGGAPLLAIRADGSIAAANGVRIVQPGAGSFIPVAGPAGSCSTAGSPSCADPDRNGAYVVEQIPVTGYADIVMTADYVIKNETSTGPLGNPWPIFEWRTTLDSITILDYADLEATVRALDVRLGATTNDARVVLGTATGIPKPRGDGYTPVQFDVRHRAGTTLVDVEKFGVGNITLAGGIQNPVGLTRVVNLGGSILGIGVGAPIVSNVVDLIAGSGSVGTAATPIAIEFIRFTRVASIDSSAIGLREPRLNVEAAADVYLSLRAQDRVAGSTIATLPVRIDRVVAGGDASIVLRTSVRTGAALGSSVVKVQVINEQSAWGAPRSHSHHFRGPDSDYDPVQPGDTTTPDPSVFDDGTLTPLSSAYTVRQANPLLIRGLETLLGTDLIRYAPAVDDGEYVLFDKGTTSPAKTEGMTAAGLISIKDSAAATATPDTSATTITLTGFVDLSLAGPGWLDAEVDGSIDLTEVSDDLRVGLVRSREGDVSLTAAKSILDGDPNDANDETDPADVFGVNIRLTATTGSIGTPQDFLEVDLANTTGSGALAASAKLGIYVTETSGDLRIGILDLDLVTGTAEILGVVSDSVDRAVPTDVALTTRNGSIRDGVNRTLVTTILPQINQIRFSLGLLPLTLDPLLANVVGVRLDLGAFGGGIGGSGAPLYVNSSVAGPGSGRVYVYAHGNIYLTETNGEMVVLGASSRDGRVELTVVDSGSPRAPPIGTVVLSPLFADPNFLDNGQPSDLIVVPTTVGLEALLGQGVGRGVRAQADLGPSDLRGGIWAKTDIELWVGDDLSARAETEIIAGRYIFVHGDTNPGLADPDPAVGATLVFGGRVGGGFTVCCDSATVVNAPTVGTVTFARSHTEAVGQLLPGRFSTFLYTVKLTGGQIGLANPVIVDDNASPFDARDDFRPVLVSGDVDVDGVLDPGEVWVYGWAYDIESGAQTSTATLTGSLAGQPVTASAVVNLTGFDPRQDIESIGLVKLVNGQDADSATTGPSLAIGSTVTFTYLVSNRSDNHAFTGVGVTDGSLVIHRISGDFNADDRLDTFETWVFEATATVLAGEQCSTATALGFGLVRKSDGDRLLHRHRASTRSVARNRGHDLPGRAPRCDRRRVRTGRSTWDTRRGGRIG